MRFIKFRLFRPQTRPIDGDILTENATTKAVVGTPGLTSASHRPRPEIQGTDGETVVDSTPTQDQTMSGNNHRSVTVLGRRDLPLTQKLWNMAVDQFIDQLQSKDRTAVLAWKNSQGLSVEDIDCILAPLKQSYLKGKSHRVMRTAYPFLDHLKSFGTVVDVCMQADPTPGALIWGLVRLVLEISTRSIELYELIEEMLESISAQLPLFEAWLRLFAESDHTEISECVTQTCCQYLDFLVNTINYFRSSQTVNMLKGATLPKFRTDFYKRREKIRRLTDHLMVQVHTAGLIAHDNRHRELRGLITSGTSTSTGDPSDVKLPMYFLQEMLRNSRFFGRKEELARIEKALQEDTARMSSVVLHGIGGCGKSTLALEYAYLKMKEYDIIAWLHADSKSKLEDQFSLFAMKCGLVEESKSMDRVYETVLNWLATCSFRWLLIYDNADDADVLAAYWPKSTKGSVIATSRDPTIRRSGLAAAGLRVGVFELKEGRNFFKSQLTWEEDLESSPVEVSAIDELVCEFDGLPIGLCTAAVYMDTKQYSPSRFLRLYKQRKEAVTTLKMPNVGKTLQTLWDVSLDSLTRDGEDYLCRLAFLDPDSIAMDLFEDELATVTDDPNKSAMRTGEELFHDALADLTSKSLVEVNRIARTIKLHRYLQSVMQARVKTDDTRHERVFRDCLSLLRARLPRTGFGYHRKPQFWDIRRAHGPHVDFLSARLAPDFTDLTATALLELVSDHIFFHVETCQVDLALAMLDTAKKIMNGRNMDQRTLSFLFYVEGLICNDTNHLEEGVESFGKARDLLEDAMKQEPRVLMDTKNLSHIYSSMGNTLTSYNRFAEAERSHRKAINLYLEANEIVEERLGRLYANLGSCLLWKGDLIAAEATLHKALLHYDRKLCCTLYALGNVYLAQRRIQRAYEVHLETLEIFSKRLGRSHPVTADSCFKVGRILSMEEFPNANLRRAEAYLRKALTIYEVCASKANQDSEVLVARAQFKLATVLERLEAKKILPIEDGDTTRVDAVIDPGGGGGTLDLPGGVAAGRESSAMLRERGLLTLRTRLGRDQAIPSDPDGIMHAFDGLVFYWSR
ncbi:hypothetical protein AYL99_09073 [Fonsecaea erecta]|uniref:Uncharacterized protein n=1 Tax=Fonsecaea erecta TaxID=1367422 RepID=A0A178ZBV3_9EURO|nr:hypothetical protein AYL99_09073 [Fonsecaea erecta]OAP56961.1 hypothetical protein AYL99_09073 [Fonsecaea erecta]